MHEINFKQVRRSNLTNNLIKMIKLLTWFCKVKSHICDKDSRRYRDISNLVT